MAERKANLRTIADPSGAVVLDIREGTISLLNETGRFVWDAIQQGLGEAAIVAHLGEATGEPGHLIEADVREFIAALRLNKLLAH